LHVRDQVLLDDARRHRPEGIEIDLVDFRIYDRRRTVDAPDHRVMPRYHAAPLDGFDTRGRYVDHHEPVDGFCREFFQPVEILRQLPEPHRRGNVERCEGRRADHAVRWNPVPALEPLHRGFDISVERPGCAHTVGQIAGNDEPLTQHLDIRIAHAEPKHLVGRDHRPSAACDDVGISLDRILYGHDGVGRHDWHCRPDFGSGDGACVEAVLPLGCPSLQDLGNRVVGRRPGREGRNRRGRNSRGRKQNGQKKDSGATAHAKGLDCRFQITHRTQPRDIVHSRQHGAPGRFRQRDSPPCDLHRLRLTGSAGRRKHRFSIWRFDVASAPKLMQIRHLDVKRGPAEAGPMPQFTCLRHPQSRYRI